MISPVVENAIDSLCSSGRGHVCFDADGVLWREDVGNSYLVSSLERGILRPPQAMVAQNAWDAYLHGEIDDGEEGRLAALFVEILQGLHEDFVAADAREFVQAHFPQHIIPQVRMWIEKLQKAGVQCWVVSGSNEWCVRAGAEILGIPPDRVLAVGSMSCNGILTGRVARPLPFGKGKAEAIRLRLPASPEMAFGNTAHDLAMLETATRMAVAVEPDESLRRVALARNWPILDLR